MIASSARRLEKLQQAGLAQALCGGLVGLEKEGLRVSPEGLISSRPHPPTLGSALTHPTITTDYSEALLELITPPMSDRKAVLAHLHATHQYVYQQIGDELLWAASMPCVLQGGENIPVARYGHSNQGLMKTVYRRGLGHRYGRSMQVIAGVHFNYSVPDAFWPLWHELEQSRLELRDFISESYMGMIRNLQRLGWVVPYLFGASPAICASFVAGKQTDLSRFDDSTLYYPHGTSLRMGDIGYQNSLEEGRGFKANYDSLDAYTRSLIWAISTSCPDNENIGVVRDGEYRQLNTSVLQIENEHYATIRPKQPPEGMEMPLMALRRRGVAYVELRSIDVNAENPLGISEEQLYFFETFLLCCMLMDSPRINATETKIIDANQILAAHHGRRPGLSLRTLEGGRQLSEWLRELLLAMLPIAEILDRERDDSAYVRSVESQFGAVDTPELTPSARMLRDMRDNAEGFFDHASRMSEMHRDYFLQTPLNSSIAQDLAREAEDSLRRQADIESREQGPFESYLQAYFDQTANPDA